MSLCTGSTNIGLGGTDLWLKLNKTDASERKIRHYHKLHDKGGKEIATLDNSTSAGYSSFLRAPCLIVVICLLVGHSSACSLGELFCHMPPRPLQKNEFHDIFHRYPTTLDADYRLLPFFRLSRKRFIYMSMRMNVARRGFH